MQRVTQDALLGVPSENEALNSSFLKGFYSALYNIRNFPENMIEELRNRELEELAKEEGYDPTDDA